MRGQDNSNRESVALIRTLTGHTDPVNTCAVSPDGSFIVSAAGNVMKIYKHKNDNTLKVWDFQTGALRFTLSGHTEAVKGCAVSRDCSTIVSVAEDCMIVWDAKTGREINRFDNPGFACSVCTDESSILIISFLIVLKNIHSGAECFSILTDDMLHACAISADGSFFITAGTDQHLVVWNTKDGERVTVLKFEDDIKPVGDIRACAISPDGTFIVSGSEDGILGIWDTKLFREKKVIISHNNWITGCAVSPDSSTVVSSSLDKTLKIWDVQSGNELAILIGHTGSVNSCTFSPCGNYIISAGDDMTVKIWDISESKSSL